MWSHIFLRRLQISAKKFDEVILIPRLPQKKKLNPERPLKINFNSDLINHLEKLSLVRFSNETAVMNLKAAVSRANRIIDVNVKNVSGLEFVWENQHCYLHPDVEEQVLDTPKVLSNAQKSYEDFFVTPPGNVPLEESEIELNSKLLG